MSLLLALQPGIDWIVEYRKYFNQLKSRTRDYSNQYFEFPPPVVFEWNSELQPFDIKHRPRPLPNRSEYDQNTIFFERDIIPEEIFEHRNMGGAVEITPPKMPKGKKPKYLWLLLDEDDLHGI